MATIPLRAYNREIEGLIDRGQIDEAVAHCMFILQSFPKNVTTYRLLGKAYLEIQRYSDGSDIFQRILSSVPDDFVSNVGMSIIREDENNLDAAIWHMERAFEAQPANAAIQEELRRLYGRRDGLEPPKVRLTRAALARMYAKGHLYQQAIGELRAALAEDPQRTDLQVLLAQMYYAAGLKVDAVNTCSTLLKKLPQCLEANRILADILPETDRSEDAQIYRQQTIAMDPYFEFTSTGNITSDHVPDEAVMATRLVYEPGSTMLDKPEQPAWATSLGVNVEDQASEPLPDWLVSDEEDISQLKSNAFIWEPEESEKTVIQEPGEIEPSSEEEIIPDWMKEAGWQPTEASVVQEFEKSAMQDSQLQEELPSEDEIESAQIPEWLREIAPEGALDQSLEGALPDELPAWLQDSASEPAEPESIDVVESSPVGEIIPSEPIEAEIPEWLQEFSPDTDRTPSDLEEMPTLLRAPEIAEQDQGVSEFLKEVEIPSVPESSIEEPEGVSSLDEIPDWLKELEVEQQVQDFDIEETVISVKPVVEQEVSGVEFTPQPIEEEIPALSEELAIESDAQEELPVEILEESEEIEIPEWLSDIESVEAKPEPVTPAEPTTETVISGADLSLVDDEAALAWLEGLAAKQGVPEDQLVSQADERLESPPSWLAEEPEEIKAVSAEAPVEPEEAELPEWLREAAIQEIPDLSTPVEETEEEVLPLEATQVGDLGLADEEAALAWLETLAAKQGVPEDQLTVPPEDRLEYPPDWLVTSPEPEAILSDEMEIEAEEPVLPVMGEESFPDWLAEPEPVAEVETKLEDQISEAQETPLEEVEKPEMPDWLVELEEEIVEEPEEAAAVSSLPEWLLVSEDFQGEEKVSDEDLEELVAKAQAETMISRRPEIVSKLDLNTASLRELEDLPGIGFILAQSILSYREINGPLSSVDELTNVNGITKEMLVELHPLVDVKVPVEKELPEKQVIEPQGEDEHILGKARSAMLAEKINSATGLYEVLVKKGAFLPEIIQDLQESLFRQPSNLIIWQLLGDAYVRNDNLDAALDAYIKAEELLR